MKMREECFYRTSLKFGNYYTDGCIILKDNCFEGSLTQDYIKGEYLKEENALRLFYVLYDVEEHEFVNALRLKLLNVEDFYLPKGLEGVISVDEGYVPFQICFIKEITDPYEISVYVSEIRRVQTRLNPEG